MVLKEETLNVTARLESRSHYNCLPPHQEVRNHRRRKVLGYLGNRHRHECTSLPSPLSRLHSSEKSNEKGKTEVLTVGSPPGNHCRFHDEISKIISVLCKPDWSWPTSNNLPCLSSLTPPLLGWMKITISCLMESISKMPSSQTHRKTEGCFPASSSLLIAPKGSSWWPRVTGRSRKTTG